MPAQVEASVLNLTKIIANLKIEVDSLKTSVGTLTEDQETLEGKIKPQKTFHQKEFILTDLIANKVPTFSGWTVNPTDAGNITDGNIATFCTTGNDVRGGAWQYAYMEWDLGGFYNVLIGGVGASTATAGSAEIYIFMWNGAAWVDGRYNISSSTTPKVFQPYFGKCSKIRIGFTGSAAATMTPNIREFNAWRLYE